PAQIAAREARPAAPAEGGLPLRPPAARGAAVVRADPLHVALRVRLPGGPPARLGSRAPARALPPRRAARLVAGHRADAAPDARRAVEGRLHLRRADAVDVPGHGVHRLPPSGLLVVRGQGADARALAAVRSAARRRAPAVGRLQRAG